jgi:hypothetical protein
VTLRSEQLRHDRIDARRAFWVAAVQLSMVRTVLLVWRDDFPALFVPIHSNT